MGFFSEILNVEMNQLIYLILTHNVFLLALPTQAHIIFSNERYSFQNTNYKLETYRQCLRIRIDLIRAKRVIFSDRLSDNLNPCQKSSKNRVIAPLAPIKSPTTL